MIFFTLYHFLVETIRDNPYIQSITRMTYEARTDTKQHRPDWFS